MSLRDRNKKKHEITLTGDGQKGNLSRTLRGATGLVKKPTGAGLAAIKKVTAKSGMVGKGNVGFLIDATGSRSSSWAEAQSIQAQMFEKISGVGAMNVRLVHFGGGSLKDNGWADNAHEIVAAMSDVQCQCGGTQILEGLAKFADDDAGSTAKSIIIVGDSFEEDFSEIESLCAQLKSKDIKLFTFLDGGCSGTQEAFKLMAELTGGAFAQFGADMPLNDLCEGVALLSVGGNSALQRLNNAAAKQLLLGCKPS